MQEDKLGHYCKELMFRHIKENLSSGDTLFLSTYSGLSVGEQEQLRKELKKMEAGFFVAKNSLFKRACAELELEQLADSMRGLSGVSYGIKDGASACKRLVNFQKDHENFEILGGYFEGRPIRLDKIKQIALLPGRKVLLAQVAGAMKSPITGCAFVLAGLMRKFIIALKKISEQEKKS